jgi:S-DNA-T family DNA segregation ATPase FtsK/SpoIIIE
MPTGQAACGEDPRNLPAVPAASGLEPEVIDGQAVDGPPPRPGAVVLRPVVQVVLVIIRHEYARTAGRHAAYIPLGAAVAARRIWESRTTARYERMIRAAEQAGDHQAALEWDARRAEFVRARHERRMQRAESRRATARTLPWFALGVVAVLFTAGVLLAVARHRAADVAEPAELLARVTGVIAAVIAAAWGPLVLAAPWVAVAALWHAGRRASAAAGPAWLRTAAEGDDLVIDERTVSKALEALRIPGIRDYLRQGLPLQYLTPCRADGRGTYAQIRLPSGVPAEQIARRRAALASGLHRSAAEVWPSTGTEAGILDLWIADKGALAEGAGPYPLLAEGFIDVFRGLPFGRTLRGDPIRIPVIGRNSICGGMPEQGKSSAARVVACGYTLDIDTELRIYVPDINNDFELFRPRCSRYVCGAEDEYIEQILGDLEELKDELQVRGQLLQDHGETEVTAALGRAGTGLHPVFWLLEEAHVAIQHPRYGKDISRLLVENVKLDRKRGIHMMVSTQAPTKDSMPRDVTRNCTVGIAFAVGDHVANDALLGQGAYAAGIRATELIPGTDRGTALCKGFSGQRGEMVQVYFVSASRGSDQVTPIIRRALDALAAEGRPVPGTERGPRPVVERDLLADLAEVLRGTSGKVRLADLRARLRKLAPSWAPYRDLNGVRLRELLGAEGVRTTKAGNVPLLDPADLRRVLTGREEDGR